MNFWIRTGALFLAGAHAVQSASFFFLWQDASNAMTHLLELCGIVGVWSCATIHLAPIVVAIRVHAPKPDPRSTAALLEHIKTHPGSTKVSIQQFHYLPWPMTSTYDLQALRRNIHDQDVIHVDLKQPPISQQVRIHAARRLYIGWIFKRLYARYRIQGPGKGSSARYDSRSLYDVIWNQIPIDEDVLSSMTSGGTRMQEAGSEASAGARTPEHSLTSVEQDTPFTAHETALLNNSKDDLQAVQHKPESRHEKTAAHGSSSRLPAKNKPPHGPRKAAALQKSNTCRCDHSGEGREQTCCGNPESSEQTTFWLSCRSAEDCTTHASLQD